MAHQAVAYFSLLVLGKLGCGGEKLIYICSSSGMSSAVRIVEKQLDEILAIAKNPAQIRNAGTLAHVDHGKTTTSDSLLMGAGLLSPKVAGKALAMDYVPIEQLRQMTVKAANISLYFEYGGKPYLINFVDTPGHVDFTGHVTRSLRVMDGGLDPQGEIGRAHV